MAPAATQTTVETTAQPTYKLHLGQYKEIEATRVDREVEEGKKGEPAAKVNRVDSSFRRTKADVK
jgi:hypothetical protein